MRWLPAALCLGALAMAGCSSGFPGRGSRSEVEELKRRVLDLQRKAALSEVEIARLRRELAELELRLETEFARPSGEAVRETSAPEQVHEVTAQEPIEEVDLEEAPTEAPRTYGAKPVSASAQALYDEGYALHHRGRYRDAEAAFQRFVQMHGETDLADNAHFWIGASRFASGDIRGALASFREVIQRYPEGNKVPDALLKTGECLEQLGDLEGAREAYGEVLRRYPETGAAVVAKQRRSDLD